jgi:hypothetical protein
MLGVPVFAELGEIDEMIGAAATRLGLIANTIALVIKNVTKILRPPKKLFFK